MKISASIIVYNEEDNIEQVCQTVSWCDEIVIVDSNSTDRTVEIASKYTDKVFQREFLGFKDKHEFADSKTTGDWIFWIDADEIVTSELRESIENLKEQDQASLPDGFWIPRKTWYLGRWIKYCGWYPDYQMRLYRKSASYWDGVAPHETARVKGETKKLTGEFLHFTKRSLSEHNKVMDKYTTLASDYLYKNGKKVGGLGIFISSVSAFFRTYFLKQGFRDGIQGLIISMFTGYSVFLKYAKLWEKNNPDEQIMKSKKTAQSIPNSGKLQP